MHNYGVKASLSEAEQLYSKILLLLIPSHEHLPDSVPLTSLQSVLSSWQEKLLSTIISPTDTDSLRALDFHIYRTYLAGRW